MPNMDPRRGWGHDDEVGCLIPLTVRQFSTADLRAILTAIKSFGWARATLQEDDASGRYFVAARGSIESLRKLVMALPADPGYREGLLKRLNQASYPVGTAHRSTTG